jgi:hypothetical protein
MRHSTTWHGTERELNVLLCVLDRHCSCLVGHCASHALVWTDQTTLDRLVFARRIADCLRREEGLPTPIIAHR